MNTNPTDKVTTKKYMVVVHVDETDEVAPNTDLREGTLIQVRDAQGDTNYKMAPNFNTDFNYYYVQIPYSETSANIFVDASYQLLDSNGNLIRDGRHDVMVNNHQLNNTNMHLVNNLVVGDNVVKVEITNTVNGNKKYYTIVINRMGPETVDDQRPLPNIVDASLTGYVREIGRAHV